MKPWNLCNKLKTFTEQKLPIIGRIQWKDSEEVLNNDLRKRGRKKKQDLVDLTNKLKLKLPRFKIFWHKNETHVKFF